MFVPMHGGIAIAMRASGRFILLRTQTKAEDNQIVVLKKVNDFQL